MGKAILGAIVYISCVNIVSLSFWCSWFHSL